MKKSNITIIISIIFVGLLIFFATNYSKVSFSTNTNLKNIEKNVNIENGKQIIKITAKGGYNPRHSIAKAGIPSVLRIDTKGTYDCTAIVRIPGLNILKNLPMYGVTDIDLGIQEKGIIEGTCGMGMYPFDIKFE